MSGLIVLALALVLGVLAFQEDIVRTWLDPKQPFQTYRPPKAPDYASASAWALEPADPSVWTAKDPPADVFFVHATTFNGGADWNGPIGDPAAGRALVRSVLPNYAGPYQAVGRVFAPRYRQASLFSFMTNREDAQDARRFAYGDVLRAFRRFLLVSGGARPFLLVGVEQGGGLAARLLRDEVAPNPELRARLVSAVFIETVVPAEEYGPASLTPACREVDQYGCVLAWRTVSDERDAERRRRRALVWTPDGRLEDLGARAPLCVNPLLGAEVQTAAEPRQSLGAANATGLEWGVRPAFSPRAASAVCKDGFLRTSTPDLPSFKRTGGWIERLKAASFNVFYADEERDAKGRLAALTSRPGYRAPTPPGVIAVEHAAIHRAD